MQTSPGAIAALHRQLSEANAQLSKANTSLEASELAATEYVGELAVLRKVDSSTAFAHMFSQSLCRFRKVVLLEEG